MWQKTKRELISVCLGHASALVKYEHPSEDAVIFDFVFHIGTEERVKYFRDSKDAFKCNLLNT